MSSTRSEKTSAEAGSASAGATDAKPSTEKKKAENPPRRKDGARETVESVLVAFILAFLFRTFEAEAFVIPTGSMAPTLRGRHKEVDCPQCGYRYAIGASEEIDNQSDLYIPANRVRHAACPNCRYVADVKDLPVFKGDRILVNKFMFEFQDPDRWDVVVFKFPEEPKTNYIKRLIGLPGEKLEIRQGDIYVEKNGKVEIQRKLDPYKQQNLQQLVYDDAYPAKLLEEKGWPERWLGVRKVAGEAETTEDSIAGWRPDEEGWTRIVETRRYQVTSDAAKDKFRWLRYRHFVPDEDDWDAVTASPPQSIQSNPRPQLITDFCGYNAYDSRSIEAGVYWVGDLTLNAVLEVTELSSGAQAMLELVEGNGRYRCRFDLESGKVEALMLDDLARGDDGEGVVIGSAETSVKGAGSWRVSFANVDDRLCLWINGKLVRFNGAPGIDYQPYGGRSIQRPWDEDLTPVGVAARNATVQVSQLTVERDVYYRGEYIRPQDYDRFDQSQWSYKEYMGDEYSLRKLADKPEEWAELYERRWVRNDQNVPESAYVFELGEDEYFMMGDNSPRSKDSRLWPQAFRGPETLHRHAVKRSALVGKAFFIYWPHGVPFLNDGRGYPDGKESILNNSSTAGWFFHKVPRFNNEGEYVGKEIAKDYYPSFRVPFYPNIGRMERIR